MILMRLMTSLAMFPEKQHPGSVVGSPPDGASHHREAQQELLLKVRIT